MHTVLTWIAVCFRSRSEASGNAANVLLQLQLKLEQHVGRAQGNCLTLQLAASEIMIAAALVQMATGALRGVAPAA